MLLTRARFRTGGPGTGQEKEPVEKKSLLKQCNKLAGADYHIIARLKLAPSIPIALILFNNPLTPMIMFINKG